MGIRLRSFPTLLALQEKTRLVIANWVDKLKTNRLTMTLPVLNSAREVAFLASGTDKAQVLRTVLEEDAPPRTVSGEVGAPEQWKTLVVCGSGRSQPTDEHQVKLEESFLD